MATVTRDIPFKELKRTEKVAIFRKHHEPTLTALGGKDAFFACKSITSSNVKGYNLPVGKVGFFESELKSDCYFELTTYDIVSTDQNRQLYRLKYDPHFRQEEIKYQLVEETPAHNPQYYVETKTFEKVYLPTKGVLEADEFNLPQEKQGDDISYEKLSARDRVCIELKVPASKFEWINDLIQKSQ